MASVVDRQDLLSSPALLARARHASSVTPTDPRHISLLQDRANHWGGMWGGARYSTEYTVHLYRPH